MKIKTAILPLIIAALGSPLLAQIPGKVGPVTVALTAIYESPGFGTEYTKVTKDTATQYVEQTKSVVTRQRYGNLQLIQDLMIRYSLTGKPADYSLQFVEAETFNGFYLVNKPLTVVIYIGGGHSDDSSLPINTHYVVENLTPAVGGSSSESISLSRGVENYLSRGSFTGEGTGTYLYLNPTGENDLVEAFCYVKAGYSYSYSEKYTDQAGYFDLKTTYTFTAGSLSGIVGTNYRGLSITGSINTAALRDVANVTPYYNAHPSRN